MCCSFVTNCVLKTKRKRKKFINYWLWLSFNCRCNENWRHILDILSTSNYYSTISLFAFTSCNVLTYSWRLTSRYYETYIVSFFHRYQPHINKTQWMKGTKLSEINTCIFLLREHCSGSYRLIALEADLLGRCAMRLGHSFQQFRTNRLWVNSRTHNTDNEWGTFLRNVGKQFPNRRRQQPNKPCFLNWQTRLQLIQSLSTVSLPAGKAVNFPLQ